MITVLDHWYKKSIRTDFVFHSETNSAAVSGLFSFTVPTSVILSQKEICQFTAGKEIISCPVEEIV